MRYLLHHIVCNAIVRYRNYQRSVLAFRIEDSQGYILLCDLQELPVEDTLKRTLNNLRLLAFANLWKKGLVHQRRFVTQRELYLLRRLMIRGNLGICWLSLLPLESVSRSVECSA